MADYSQAELLNEVSQIFRAGLDAGKDGGTLNTATQYQQILEMASITFLFNPDAIFYVSRLAANQLTSIISQEAAILEDILVGLDDLGQIGSPVRDTASLSNAKTAVLSLDAAQTVNNRPESARFMKQMDKFAEQVRKNVVDPKRGPILVRPREDARNIIKANLGKLGTLHASLLDQLSALMDSVNQFLEMDIPSKVSSSVLTTISSRLDSAMATVAVSTDAGNLQANRDLFLQTLANKISVKVIADFVDPTDVKYRSPIRPVPPTLKHLGRVVGEGDAASVLTSAGPWTLPISDPLVLAISGGSPVSIDLDEIPGAVLNSRNSQSYQITAGSRNLHCVIDSNTYSGTVSTATASSVTLNEFLKLGFKHLGAPVAFLNAVTTPSDLMPRFITEMRSLQTASSGAITFSDPLLTVTSTSAGDEGATGFHAGHVGAYIEDSAGKKFEVIRVIDATHCEIDARGIVPSFVSGLSLRGQLAAGTGTTKFDVSPSLTTTPSASDAVTVGAAVKTVQLTTGARSVANIISDIEAEGGVFDTGDDGAKLNWHVVASPVFGDPTRLALRIRSKLNPFIQVSGRFLHPKSPVAAPVIESDSAHSILGFYEGETDSTNLLTPSELVSLVREKSGLDARVVTTEVFSGTLESVPGLSKVTDEASTDLSSMGVASGDQIEISDGTVAGTYRITALPSSSTLTLDRAAFSTKESGLVYRIFREQVQIFVTAAGPDSSLEVVSAPSELSLTNGIVYSSISLFEAADPLSSKLKFSGVVPGDLLKVVGVSGETVIAEVQEETRLRLETGLPSTSTKVGFEIRSAAARAFSILSSSLQTFVTSNNLLKKNNFDQGIEAIDNALTTAVLPGQNFAASRNQAKLVVADLLQILTSDLQREDEYSASVTPDPNNLKGSLDAYEVTPVPVLDSYLATLLDRKYERAASLLSQGKMADFYATTDETASFSGAVMAASRQTVKDLPRNSRTRFDFLNERDLAQGENSGTDADQDFTDTDESPETPDI